MADPRLNSSHFESPTRREQYQAARRTLLGARGWLTMAAECFRGLAGSGGDWPALVPVRPDQVLPGTRFVLVDRRAGCAYPLRTGLNTVGRRPDNDIVCDDRYVSRRHCVILVHAGGAAELHDTASLNGTLLNGRRVGPPVRLAPGDRIRVCDRELVYLREEDLDAEPGGGGSGTVRLDPR
jgi:pSer/pThr/pTyr-binding forkhead associated (FHA) protein